MSPLLVTISRSARHPAVATAAALSLLALSALPSLRRTVDDTLITAAYAWRILDGHGWTWGTGEHVDGVSSPVQLGLMIAVAAAGGDVLWVCRAASAVGAIVIVSWIARLDGRTAIALATCSAFAYWSLMTMETLLACAIGAIGWVAARRGHERAGAAVLTLFAFCRPEGVAWLILGARGRGRIVGIAVCALAAAAHFLWFGAIFPSAFAVKMVGGAFRDGGSRLLLGEAIGLAGVVLAAWRARRGWVADAAPLAVGVAAAGLVGADWMGHGRLLLPGVVATVCAWSSGRGSIPGWLVWPAVVIGWATQTDVAHDGVVAFRPKEELVRPWAALSRPEIPPQVEDVRWMMAHAPSGGKVMTSDVGMPGNVDGIGVFDLYGLVDGEVARDGASAELARFDLDDGPGRVDCLRVRRSPQESGVDLPPWRPAGYQLCGGYWEDEWATEWWCRPGTVAPEPSVVTARIENLSRRYPAYASQLDLAPAAFDIAAWQTAWDERTAFAGAAFVAGRGFPMYTNGQRRSRVIRAGERLSFDVDAPGADGAAVVIEWEGGAKRGDPPMERRIHARTVVDLPPFTGPAPRLLVRFVNDQDDASGDRNLYVGLRPPG
ncbi:MAG: hypothetical protein EXR71_02750 [Myxococcales bacterium]|nr:hypothetical protein [Myxococcales bacterium]